MKKHIILVILCVIFAQYSRVHAQNQNISVNAMIGFPSQAYYSQSYSFSIVLQNHDTSSYTGNVDIQFYTVSSNATIDSLSFGIFPVSLPGNNFDTVPVVGYTFDSASYKMGGNVVVVWPVSNGGTQITVVDTFFTNVDILGYSGISDMTKGDKTINIYPVPANDKIFLPESLVENDIEHVRIFDVLGCTKTIVNGYPKYISVEELENGFYFLEVKYKNNQVRIFKFIVSK